jgi:hypothetical protein
LLESFEGLECALHLVDLEQADEAQIVAAFLAALVLPSPWITRVYAA